MTVPSPGTLRFHFLDFELDGDTFELRRGHKVVALRPQAATLLQLLVANAGRLVTREEIREAVWGDAAEGDFEGSLHSCVRHVRAALGESAEAGQMLHTFPRRGYRFDAPVSWEPLVAASPDSGEPPIPSPADAARWPSMRVTAGALVLVVATVLVMLAVGGAEGDRSSAGDSHVLAVIPFRVLSEGVDERFFGEGLSAELLGAVDGLRSDRVVLLASGSNLGSPAGQGDAEGLAVGAGATLLLSGMVRGTGETVRVSAQLVRLSDGAQLWSSSYDGDPADALAIQRLVIGQIVEAVRAELSK